jgi:hypothetical protein
VLLCDAADGTVVGRGSAPHPAGTECDPAAWWAALLQAGGALLERAAAVGVAGQQHGMIVLDDEGQVIRPALLWNDLRSAAAATELIRELGGIRLITITDNLVAQKLLPPIIHVMIQPGTSPNDRAMRSIEYDTVSDRYPRFLRDEILAEAKKPLRVKEMVEFERPLAGELTFYQRIRSTTPTNRVWLTINRSDLIDGEERLLRYRVSGRLQHLGVGAEQLSSRFTLRQPHERRVADVLELAFAPALETE